MSLTVIVPTKGRPANAARLAEAFRDTRLLPETRLVLAIDHDEAARDEYFAQVPSYPWLTIAQVEAKPQRMGPVLNVLAVSVACQEGVTHVGFMGDDHLPVSEAWDRELTGSLGDSPGVAYGNDRAQGEKLPTACVISSDIIRALGFMCPPAQEHLYLDDFWKTLGMSTHLVYRNDVVIEHLHPNYGKARWDEGYAATNSADQYARDQVIYAQFMAEAWPVHLAALREELARD